MNTRVTRRLNFSGQSKAAVALKVLRGDKMVHEIAAKRQLKKLRKLRIRTAKSKSFTPRLVSWRSKMIFCYRG